MVKPAVWQRVEKSAGARPCFLLAAVLDRPGVATRGRPPRRRARALLPAIFGVLIASRLAAAGYDWPQYNGNAQHSGNNTQETILTSANVSGLAFAFQAALPAVADGAPVYLSAVTTLSGVRDLLFVTTRAGHILALDAHTGATIWSHQYGAGTCRINNGSSLCYTTSSPAIDPNRQFVYSYGLDGRVHKYQTGDGTEIMAGGWPETVTLKGFNEKESPALAVATAGGASYLYVGNGGYPGDAGDYQGHLTAIRLADGSQKVFNSLCSDQTVHFVETPGTPDCAHVQSAIWARVGAVYDDVTNRIFVATGNGLYDGNAGGHEWGDSVLALNPDGTGSGGVPLDAYTPTNFQNLDNTDEDLGSTAPAILPAAGYSGRLAVQSGKDANLRLIDLTNLSGMGGPGHLGGELQLLPVPQGGEVLSALAVWINPADSSTWVFVTNDFGSSGLRLTLPAGVPTLTAQWHNGQSGFSPLVANNVLYSAQDGSIRAVDPLTATVLWSDSVHVGGIHWESPVVANGVLYITDESSRLTAYALPASLSTVNPPSGPTAGGISVTLGGTNLAGTSSVTFGGLAAAITSNTSTQVTVTAPPHSAGFVDVVVTAAGGPLTLTNGFQYIPPSPRVFVSAASGSDANSCTRAAACRTFARAISMTSPGGEIVVSDSGAYGPVTITQSVSLEAPPGRYAGITVSSGDAVAIAAGTNDVVTLRGLTLNGQPGSAGIHFSSGAALNVEDCSVSGFADGVLVDGPGDLSIQRSSVRSASAAGVALVSSSPNRATLENVRLEGNATGLLVSGGARACLRGSLASGNTSFAVSCIAGQADVDDCLLTANGTALASSSTGTLRVSDSILTDNGTGAAQSGSAVLLSRSNNTLEGNSANVSGSVTGYPPR